MNYNHIVCKMGTTILTRYETMKKIQSTPPTTEEGFEYLMAVKTAKTATNVIQTVNVIAGDENEHSAAFRPVVKKDTDRPIMFELFVEKGKFSTLQKDFIKKMFLKRAIHAI